MLGIKPSKSHLSTESTKPKQPQAKAITPSQSTILPLPFPMPVHLRDRFIVCVADLERMMVNDVYKETVRCQ